MYKHNISFSNLLFSDGITENEIKQVNENADILYEVWFNNATLIDGFSKANMLGFYPGTEGPDGGDQISNLVDSTTITIDGHTANTRTFFEDNNFGPSNLTTIQDSNGTITGLIDSEMINVSTVKYIDTGFLANMAEFSIEDIVTIGGVSEHRVMVKDPSGDRYYINAILQGSVPAFPDPSVTIKLNNITAIGTQDPVTEKCPYFKVHNYVMTLEQVQLSYDTAKSICSKL